MKTNIGLVEYCKAQLGNPYWFGTFGQIATEKLLVEKGNQYPRYLSKTRQTKAIARGDIGKKVHDCYGLPKGYLMSEGPAEAAVYNSKYDISADAAFAAATEKGSVNSLPEIPGILLWRKGHVGVYIGNGREIEARGFDYGVVEDDVKNTTFTKWFKMPELEYVKEGATQGAEPSAPTEPSAPASQLTTYKVVKGDTLSRIAARFGVNVEDLVKWNSIANPDLIVVGQVLVIGDRPVITDPPKEYFKGRVNTQKLPLNIRRFASTNAPVIGTLPKGAEVKLAYETAGWCKLYGREGFVSAKFIVKM